VKAEKQDCEIEGQTSYKLTYSADEKKMLDDLNAKSPYQIVWEEEGEVE